MLDPAFCRARVDALQKIIVAYEEALLGIASGALESYSLDTGQTVQKVTKINIHTLQMALNTAINQCAIWSNRANGGGAFYGRPQC
ncbi:MAG: hypothetical protein GY767_22715 [Shimia sp.]|nr:hypothetical protein [Shimia sp.]